MKMKHLVLLTRITESGVLYVVMDREGNLKVFRVSGGGDIVDETSTNQNLIEQARTMIEKYEKLLPDQTRDVSPEEFFDEFPGAFSRMFTPVTTDDASKGAMVLVAISNLSNLVPISDRRKFGELMKKVHELLDFVAVKEQVPFMVKEVATINLTDYISIKVFPANDKTFLKVTFSNENDVELFHIATLLMKNDDRIKWSWEDALSKIPATVPKNPEIKNAIIRLNKKYKERLSVINVLAS